MANSLQSFIFRSEEHGLGSLSDLIVLFVFIFHQFFVIKLFKYFVRYEKDFPTQLNDFNFPIIPAVRFQPLIQILSITEG